MINEQTTQQVGEIRRRLYELLSKCIPADIIIRVSYFLCNFIKVIYYNTNLLNSVDVIKKVFQIKQ